MAEAGAKLFAEKFPNVLVKGEPPPEDSRQQHLTQMIAGNNLFVFNFLDLSLILIAYWAMCRGRVQALFVGSVAGILMDAILGWPLGYNGFGKTLAAYFIGAAAKRFNLEGPVVRFAVITSSSCLSSLSVFILFGLLQRKSSAVFLGASLIQAVVTGAVGTLVLSVLEAYSRTRFHRTI